MQKQNQNQVSVTKRAKAQKPRPMKGSKGTAPTPYQAAKQGRRPVSVAPVAIGNRTFQSKPKYESRGDKLIVSHTEYLGDITGSSAAYSVAQTLPLNPGLSTSFPWLNQIASRYESYKFKKLHFRFMTERPTTESGFVALVPDYDPTDPSPIDKVSAFQYQNAAKCAPWENLTQINSTADLGKRKSFFVRQGALAGGETLGLYDSGNLFVCVGGNSGSVALGELWCDYQVEFDTPQLDSNYGSGDSGRITGTSGPTPAFPFGPSPVSVFGKAVLWSAITGGSGIKFLTNFQGLINVHSVGTNITVQTPTCSGAVTLLGNYIDAGALTGDCTFLINVVVGDTLTYVVTASTITSCNLRAGNFKYSLD